MVENPAAFPCTGEGFQSEQYTQKGMTLRDYFAVHADQPGVSEITSMAGVFCPDNFHVYADASKETELGNFNDWWNTLTLTERLALSARVRFAMADAMLAARVDALNTRLEKAHV